MRLKAAGRAARFRYGFKLLDPRRKQIGMIKGSFGGHSLKNGPAAVGRGAPSSENA